MLEHYNINKIVLCASKDSDQPWHLSSLCIVWVAKDSHLLQVDCE